MNRPLETAFSEATGSDPKKRVLPEWMKGVKRSEGWRKFFHVLGISTIGVLAILIESFALKLGALLVVLVLFTAHESIRRNVRQFCKKLEGSSFSFLVWLSHKSEFIHRENEIGERTSTTDCLLGTISALLFVQLFDPTPAVSTAAFILAWADPAGGLIGKRWGRFKLPKSDKTVLGSAAVFSVALIITWLTTFFYRPEMVVQGWLPICLVVATVATFAEWLPTLDFRIREFKSKTPADNFWMIILVTMAFTAVW